jgi:HEAT repeat protein
MGEASGRGGPPAGELARRLRSADVVVRLHAAVALTERGAEAAEAVPALRAALRDEDAQVRRLAAWVLGHTGGAEAAAALAQALADEDEGVRRLAEAALAEAGEGEGRAA